jgi:hypothetical protein
MDQDRTIRFLVAPILFVASLLWGAWSDETMRRYLTEINKFDWSKLIGIIASGSVVVFAAGYVVGTWSYFVLRLVFRFRPRCCGESRFHEAAMSDATLDRVWSTLGANPEASKVERRRQELFVGAAFDCAVLRKDHKGVHKWLFRRWNGFNIAVTSLWALYLSLPFGLLVVEIRWTNQWGVR